MSHEYCLLAYKNPPPISFAKNQSCSQQLWFHHNLFNLNNQQLSFDCPARHTADNILLHKDKDQRHRNDRNDRKRRQITPLCAVLSHKVKDTCRDRTFFLIEYKCHAVGEIAPCVEEGKDRTDHDAGLCDRYQNPEKRTHSRTAVDIRRLLERLWNRSKIVF